MYQPPPRAGDYPQYSPRLNEGQPPSDRFYSLAYLGRLKYHGARLATLVAACPPSETKRNCSRGRVARSG